MLNLINNFIKELNATGMVYCHWKSNIRLAASLDGQTDIDLLLHREDADAFRAILRQLHFRQAQLDDDQPFPAMEHYYAPDEESGVLVHVHVYYAVITGESLAKNYRFPLDEMLFRNR